MTLIDHAGSANYLYEATDDMLVLKNKDGEPVGLLTPACNMPRLPFQPLRAPQQHLRHLICLRKIPLMLHS